MTEAVGTFDRIQPRYISEPVDKRAMRRRGEVEGELGVDNLLKKLNWGVSSLQPGKGGEILTVKPKDGPVQPFLQFKPADKQRGERNHRVLFNSGAAGVEIGMSRMIDGVRFEEGKPAALIDGLVGGKTATLSLAENGAVSFVVSARKGMRPEDLSLEEGESGANSSLVYSMGEAGKIVISNVDPSAITEDADGVHVSATNEYGEVVGTFGSDGSVALVLLPRQQK